jgi:hypothetical protein
MNSAPPRAAVGMPRHPPRIALGLAFGFLLGLCACDRVPGTGTSVPAIADAAERGAASPALTAASAPDRSIYSVVPPNARL